MQGLWVAALLVLSAFVAGCADGNGNDGADDPLCGPSADMNATTDPRCPTLDDAAPSLDARTVLDSLHAFAHGFPYRQSETPSHLAARNELASKFQTAGLEVVRQKFPASFLGAPLPYEGENILGIKWGTDRDHWIVVGAHYDLDEGAVYGAYDDGSGTALVFNLAAAFAPLNTTRTIVFAEFDQEERGTVGSDAFVRAVKAGTFQYNGTLDGMIDLDMIGITYPHPADIIVWENSDDLTAKIQELAVSTGMPADQVQFRKPHGGSSDGAVFIAAGIPTAYLFSDWDEYHLPDGTEVPGRPVVYAGAYAWWHKLDTYETMVQAAGSETILEGGFQTVLDIVSPLLSYMASPAFVPPIEE